MADTDHTTSHRPHHDLRPNLYPNFSKRDLKMPGRLARRFVTGLHRKLAPNGRIPLLVEAQCTLSSCGSGIALFVYVNE